MRMFNHPVCTTKCGKIGHVSSALPRHGSPRSYPFKNVTGKLCSLYCTFVNSLRLTPSFSPGLKPRLKACFDEAAFPCYYPQQDYTGLFVYWWKKLHKDSNYLITQPVTGFCITPLTGAISRNYNTSIHRLCEFYNNVFLSIQHFTSVNGLSLLYCL